MAIFNLTIDTGTAADPITSGSRERTLRELRLCLDGLDKGVGYGGPASSSFLAAWENVSVAKGRFFLDGATGACTGTINGTDVALFLTGTSDPVKANALAAAINSSAGAKVQGYVSAVATSGALGSTVTVLAAVPGVLGNLCTLSGSGAGFKAVGADNASTSFQSGSAGTFSSWRL